MHTKDSFSEKSLRIQHDESMGDLRKYYASELDIKDREIERLCEENTDLDLSNATLDRSNHELRDEIERLQADNERLRGEIARYGNAWREGKP